MAIDLDSFFSNVEKNTENIKVQEEVKKEKVDLDFQKDVEDKIQKASNDIDSKDFKFLESMYNEIKKFEGDLPNKFLGIKATGDEALKKISNKYSQEFLKSISEHVNNLKENINSRLTELKSKIQTNDFDSSIKIYQELIRYYNLFPKEYTLQKIDIGAQIKQVNIELNQKLKIYKSEQLKKIKVVLGEEIKKLYSLLRPGESKRIERKIQDIQNILNRIPKLFSTEIIDEKINVTTALLKAENFLKTEYKRDFEERKEIIFSLFNRFQKETLNKDLEKSLTTYNEILIEFEKIPEVFLDQKIEIYKQINNLYSSINNLLLTDSVSKFMKTYSYSKTLDEIKDYLRHMKTTKRGDINAIIMLKNKLKDIPEDFTDEKNILLNRLNQILMQNKKHHEENQKHDQEKEEKPQIDLFEIKDKLMELRNQNKISIENLEDLKKQIQKANDSNAKNILLEKVIRMIEILNERKKSNTPKQENKNNLKEENDDELDIGKNVKADKKIIDEINLCYKKLKESSDKNELKMLYKKILFYLNVVHFNNEIKKKIIHKVNHELQSKKLS